MFPVVGHVPAGVDGRVLWNSASLVCVLRALVGMRLLHTLHFLSLCKRCAQLACCCQSSTMFPVVGHVPAGVDGRVLWNSASLRGCPSMSRLVLMKYLMTNNKQCQQPRLLHLMSNKFFRKFAAGREIRILRSMTWVYDACRWSPAIYSVGSVWSPRMPVNEQTTQTKTWQHGCYVQLASASRRDLLQNLDQNLILSDYLWRTSPVPPFHLLTILMIHQL